MEKRIKNGKTYYRQERTKEDYRNSKIIGIVAGGFLFLIMTMACTELFVLNTLWTIVTNIIFMIISIFIGVVIFPKFLDSISWESEEFYKRRGEERLFEIELAKRANEESDKKEVNTNEGI